MEKRLNKEIIEQPADLKLWAKPEIIIIDKNVIEGGPIVFNGEQWASGTAS